ncbi:hypothetical protein AbraIFM66951_006262 [Aspergillus brasiliensis]|uniref:Uncharacterized protein n=1 Tax=Aspergillus brasiliensis TaxID=319629 RepID=A0A9W5Z587_9EURO|nr:hypothetical protein AbraCBS73388_005892 [Aspergillus brasiliensis]GKZ51612.1 hypothetical protein AbraIFM66951_006262 [Aspergillus brasiliensis]
MQKNCRRFETIPPKLALLVNFSPQLKEKTAVEVPEVLSAKLEKEPNAARRGVLLTAIHQYDSSSTCNIKPKEAIDRAKAKFHEGSGSRGTDDIWFNVFADLNYCRRSLFADINSTRSTWGYSYVGENWNGCSVQEH